MPTNKTSVDNLAILGGTPCFGEPLHVGRPNIGDRDRLLERINDLLDRRWLSNNGLYVQELESRLADYLGVKHCIAICNGTVALEIAIRSLQLEGEVIIPSLTFIATAHALQWQRINPVFCDVDPTSFTIDPKLIENHITENTTGIIGVHLWGHPCNVEALTQIARKHDLSLLFDAAHALGCSHNGTLVGGFGDAEVFSFHATKFVNSFEGGAITTDSTELADKIRLMKNFGFSGYDNVIYSGTNGKMSEICAAMGITSLESIDSFIATNQNNYHAYRSGLDGIPGIQLLHYLDNQQSNYQYVVALLDEKLAGISRDQLIDVLHHENVMARRYFYPGCHRMEPYRSQQPQSGHSLPETESIVERTVILPTGTGVDSQSISQICGIIRYALENPDLVKHSERTR